MAQLDEKKLREELARKKVRSFYYFCGEEQFKAQAALQDLKRTLFPEGPGDFDLQVFSGDEVKAARLLDAANSLGFFASSGRKLFLVKNADALPSKEWEALKPLVENPPEHQVLVFLGKKFDQRLKQFQWISKGGDALALVKFEAVRDSELPHWCGLLARDRGVKLEPEALRLLCEWAGADLYDLQQSLEKAALYAAPAVNITEEHVRAVNVRLRPESVFEFTEAVLHKRRAPALGQLQALLDQGEEPIALLALLVRQYRLVLQILARRAEGMGDESIVSDLRLYPRQAQTLFAASKRLGGKAVIRALDQLAEADRQLKSSREPGGFLLHRVAAELLV